MPSLLITHLRGLAILGYASLVAVSGAFNISVQYLEDGKYVRLPTWYGDGRMYVGTTVPAGIREAFNYTVPDPPQADLLYIEPTTSATFDTTTTTTTTSGNPPPTVRANNPRTFLALTDAPGAYTPLLFTATAAGLGARANLAWRRYETNLFASLPPAGTLADRFYLEPREKGEDGDDDDEVYMVVWRGTGAVKREHEDEEVDGELKMKMKKRRTPKLKGRRVELITWL
ncbi:hypothetical protein F4780DRAFT_40953 [Xylariomycetidae sp. FL0641]|nr:hypothetical protein F4780DRAFT_40953 [Xylariomycetidae sp. FL0641]